MNIADLVYDIVTTNKVSNKFTVADVREAIQNHGYDLESRQVSSALNYLYTYGHIDCTRTLVNKVGGYGMGQPYTYLYTKKVTKGTKGQPATMELMRQLLKDVPTDMLLTEIKNRTAA